MVTSPQRQQPFVSASSGADSKRGRLDLRWLGAQLRTLGRSAMSVRTDDPFSFWLLVAQQLPAPLVRGGAATVLAVLSPLPRTVAWRCLALWVRGHEPEALEVARAAETGPAKVSVAQFYAAVRQYDAALRILDAVPVGDRHAMRVGARLSWRRGDLRAALQAAPAAGLSPRVLRRWSGDLQMLEPGWLPSQGATRARPVAAVPGRVLHLLTNSLPVTRSGYTSRSHEILCAQRAAGLDPVAVTRSGFPAVAGKLAVSPVAHVDGIEYRRISPWTLPRSTDLQAAVEVDLMARQVEELRPAVIHTTTHYVNALTALSLRERFEVPVVYEVRGFLEETWLSVHGDDAMDSDRFTMWRDRETECMRMADVVVTLGEAMRADILSRGISPSKVVVAPNAVADDVFEQLPGREAVRAGLGIGPGDLLVGSVTSVVPYEGLDTLVDAVAVLGVLGVPAVLLVVGDGTARAALEKRAAAAGIRAVFTGRVPAARARAYREALDAFVVPRRDERVTRLVTPLKPVEAMAAAVPVVASDLAPLREIVEDGRTGLIVPPQDPDSLAHALARLATEPDLGRALGAAGQDWARTNRTWTSTAQTYLDAYSTLGAWTP